MLEVELELVCDDDKLEEILDCRDEDEELDCTLEEEEAELDALLTDEELVEEVVVVEVPGRVARYTPTPAISKITITTTTAIDRPMAARSLPNMVGALFMVIISVYLGF